MAFTVAQLLEETDHAEVVLKDGSTVGFTYRVLFRDQFTDAEHEDLKELSGRPYHLLALPKMVTDWELVTAKGEPIPVTKAAIESNKVPTGFLGMVDRAIAAAELSGKAPSGSSRAT